MPVAPGFKPTTASARCGSTMQSLLKQTAPLISRRRQAVKVHCALQQRQVHHVHRRLPLRQVALGSSGTYVILYKKYISWSAGLPYYLWERLDQAQHGYEFVSLGRSWDVNEVWFYKDRQGTTWMGASCDTTLSNAWWGGNGDHRVEEVSFAPYGGWYLTKTGGGARWSGLPDSLDDSLAEQWDKYDGVHHLSVGHNGEWFVLYGDGTFEWCGVHPVLANLLKHRGDMTGAVEWVELGPDGSFVALFENHTVWFGNEDLTEAMYDVMSSRRSRSAKRKHRHAVL